MTMDYNAAEARLQEMRLEAYDAVLRCFRDKSLHVSAVLRETIQTKLRLEFGITTEMHTQMLSRAIQDESQPAVPASRGYPAPEPPAKSQPARKSKPPSTKHAAVLDLNAHVPAMALQAVQGPALTYVPSNTDGAAGRKRRVNEFNFRKVSRFWPNEGGWWDAIVTKYNPDNGVCELVYGFGTSKVTKEAYNMHTCTQENCLLTNEYASQSEIKKWKSWN